MGRPLAPQAWLAPPEDEALARFALVGFLTHHVIATVLHRRLGCPAATIEVTVAEVLADAQRLLQPPTVEARAHRQVLCAAVLTYFRGLLPPPSWSVLAAEPLVGRARPDVLWRAPSGQILIDEIKTGRLGTTLAGTTEQALRYLDAGTAAYGPALLGVRVLATAEPATSWMLMSDRTRRPLAATRYLAGGPRRARRRAPTRTPVDAIGYQPRPPPVGNT
ncbi:hypothetical protein FB474_2380 [Oryzihumus leptocrescens]|uniref:PD-(D/E)XK nuclease superfamily protein n=1 Tax=Oryzihumus leptocrescens TaxID=297536 RepID=A0A542ZKU3_9MICO|nr:hypothetical protein FB474_2380 [Oryzihumus leptocrescens]